LTEGARTERGTDVILYLNSESEEFLSQHKLQEILDKYAKFLPVPVKLGTRTEQEEDGQTKKESRSTKAWRWTTSSTTPLPSGPKRPPS
jgi:molecular chaperone HtpG